MTPGEYVASYLQGIKKPAPSAAGGIVGDTSGSNPSGKLLAGAAAENYGGTLKTVMQKVWDSSPFSISDKVAVPLARATENTSAAAADGSKALLVWGLVVGAVVLFLYSRRAR